MVGFRKGGKHRGGLNNFLSAGVALRSRAAAVARKSALAVAVARFAIHAHSGVRSAAQTRALTNRVALAVVGVGVGRGVGVGIGVGRSQVRAGSSVQSGARVLVAQHAAVLGVIRAAITLSSAVTVAEASSTVGFVAAHGSSSRKRSAALGSNARDVVVSSISSRSVASAVASTVSRSIARTIARTVAPISSVVAGGSSHAVVVRVQGEGRVSQARVVRAVGELASASVPSVSGLTLACALLLHVVARVQLAVVSRGARLGVREAGAASGILRSGRGGGDQVSVAIRLSAISAPIPIAGDIVGVGVSPKGTLVELHGGSHVHVLLPSLLRKFLSSDHGKGSSEGNGGVSA